MRELSMRFLHGAELRLGDETIHLPRQRSLALLAFLAITGRPHTRDELAALLTTEGISSQERKLLRNALTTLSEQLGDYLLTDRQTIAFNTTLPHRLDVAALDALLAADAVPDLAAFEAVLAHYDRELLAGLALRDAPLFESWLIRARAQVREQLQQAAHRLLEETLRRGELARGIAAARHLLAIEPWQEGYHRHLMRLLARDGQGAAARAQYDQCRHALADEFGVEPQAETTALYERLHADPFTPRHNLPSMTTTLIGREEELAEITRLLAIPNGRLVTLVGLGGSGKTRLALAAAARFTTPVLLAADHPFPDGCYLIDLSGVAGASDAPAAERRVAMAIGLALGAVFHGHLDWLDQLVAYLRPKRMLLILDGLERLLAGEGAVQAILRDAPQITLLVTTRTRLHGTLGQVRELDGLARPPNREAVELAPASRLIFHEAQRLNVRLTPEDWPHIARICRLVDGLPLALLITSGWLRAMSCAEIARELEEGDRIFAESARRRATGHEGLRAIMASTWQALSRPDRQALRHLAVFQGYFDRTAAEAIGVQLSGLLALRDSSLLEHDGDDRYRLHQLVRRYAAGRLALNPTEEARVRARHAAFYAVFLARWGNDRMQRPGGYADIGTTRADLVAAWDWSVEHLDLGLIAQLRDGLATWFQLAGLHHEWARMLAAAVERHRTALAIREEPSLRVSLGWLLATEANARMWQGELERALPLLDQARGCARAVGMIPLEIRVSLYEGRLLHYQGESNAAFDLLNQALTLARALQERRLEAEALLSLGLAAVDVGDFASAEAQLLQAQHHYRAIGDQLALGRLVVQQSRLYVSRAEYIRAGIALGQGLAVAQSFGNSREEGWAHVYLGITRDLGLGNHREAAAHLDRAHAIAEESGDLRFWTMVCWAQGLNALHIGAFDRAARAFAQSLDYGRAADSAIAVGRALYGLGLLAHARGDMTTAEDLARQAVRIAEDTGRRPDQATWLVLLGRARRELGQPATAGTFRQARTLASALPLPAVCCEAEAGLTDVALHEGLPEQAVVHAAAAFAYLQDRALAGCDEPGWVIRACHHAFRATGDARTEETLRLGAALLERRLAALALEDRTSYLSAFPARQEVLESWRTLHALPGRPRILLTDHFSVSNQLEGRDECACCEA